MLKMIAKGSTGQNAYMLQIRDSVLRFAWKINYPYEYRVGVSVSSTMVLLHFL